jgi:hypothetical protein
MRELWDQAFGPEPVSKPVDAAARSPAANALDQVQQPQEVPPAAHPGVTADQPTGDAGPPPDQERQDVPRAANPPAPTDHPAGAAAPPPVPDPGPFTQARSRWRDRLTLTSVRRSRLYQASFQKLRWEILPFLFGMSLLVGGVFAALMLFAVVWYRFDLANQESAGKLCPKDITSQPLQSSLEMPGEFTIRSLCWPTGVTVEKDRQYRVFLEVTQRWVENGNIYTSPTGFESGELGWYGIFGIALRRSVSGRWLQPIVTILARSKSETHLLEMRNIGGSTFVGAFTAGISGSLTLSVNEAMIALYGWTDEFYRKDRGSAKVTIEQY